jgi:organic hydroperoxide reductase OsmC/OhrA
VTIRTVAASVAWPLPAGSPEPTELLLRAVASCQMKAFMAVAAKARVEVLSYADDATGTMPMDVRPIRFDGIVLRPRIELAEGPTEERVRHLVEVAHHECYVSSSLATPVRVEPEIRIEGAD